jgi:hypothetical protein
VCVHLLDLKDEHTHGSGRKSDLRDEHTHGSGSRLNLRDEHTHLTYSQDHV